MKTPSSLSLLLLLLTFSFCLAAERCHPHDKRALLQIKQQSFNASVIFDSWDAATDCCTAWFFVRCDDSTNRITTFILLGADTQGTPFPSALGRLPYLQQLIFTNNATGSIPSSLSNLRRLVYLDLSSNLLTGPVPSFFSSLPNLTTLDLSRNALTGRIPPRLSLAPSLVTLHLSGNRLTGPIPASFGSFAGAQVDVALADNALSGEIPRSLERVKFFSLDVSGNRLRGDASFLFGEDKTASNLVLSRNALSFDITNLGFPRMINVLELSHNDIYGRLPAGLAALPQLNLFDVSYNRLCGKIPTGGTLAQFDRTAYLHNKCLCGTPLPPCH